jgi:hypothetical protein
MKAMVPNVAPHEGSAKHITVLKTRLKNAVITKTGWGTDRNNSRFIPPNLQSVLQVPNDYKSLLCAIPWINSTHLAEWESDRASATNYIE